MADWNLYSTEVREERETLRAYGFQHQNRWPRTNTYKGQAKRELAHRLELESQLKEKEGAQAAVVDLFDGLDTDELMEQFAKLLPHLKLEQVKRLRRRAMG